MGINRTNTNVSDYFADFLQVNSGRTVVSTTDGTDLNFRNIVPAADGSNAGLISSGAQTIGGRKTFQGGINAVGDAEILTAEDVMNFDLGLSDRKSSIGEFLEIAQKYNNIDVGRIQYRTKGSTNETNSAFGVEMHVQLNEVGGGIETAMVLSSDALDLRVPLELDRASSDPSNAEDGSLYYHTGNNEIRVRVNGSWTALPTSFTSANNNTITIEAGTGLTTGGDFTLNQSSDETIQLNVDVGITDGKIPESSGIENGEYVRASNGKLEGRTVAQVTSEILSKSNIDSAIGASGSGNANLFYNQRGQFMAAPDAANDSTITISTSAPANGGGSFTLDQSNNATISIGVNTGIENGDLLRANENLANGDYISVIGGNIEGKDLSTVQGEVVTKSTVDSAIGASSTGSTTMFYNERGQFVSVTDAMDSVGYDQIQLHGTNLTKRAILNFSQDFTVVDESGESRTDIGPGSNMALLNRATNAFTGTNMSLKNAADTTLALGVSDASATGDVSNIDFEIGSTAIARITGHRNNSSNDEIHFKARKGGAMSDKFIIGTNEIEIHENVTHIDDATAAANAIIHQIDFQGKDNAATPADKDYARIQVITKTVTGGMEDGEWSVQVMDSGTLQKKLLVDNVGLTIGNQTEDVHTVNGTLKFGNDPTLNNAAGELLGYNASNEIVRIDAIPTANIADDAITHDKIGHNAIGPHNVNGVADSFEGFLIGTGSAEGTTFAPLSWPSQGNSTIQHYIPRVQTNASGDRTVILDTHNVVTANPTPDGTETLSKLQVGSTVYTVPTGGGGGGGSTTNISVNGGSALGHVDFDTTATISVSADSASPNNITWAVRSGAISATEIADNAVTTAKIADDAVTSAQLGDVRSALLELGLNTDNGTIIGNWNTYESDVSNIAAGEYTLHTDNGAGAFATGTTFATAGLGITIHATDSDAANFASIFGRFATHSCNAYVLQQTNGFTISGATATWDSTNNRLRLSNGISTVPFNSAGSFNSARAVTVKIQLVANNIVFPSALLNNSVNTPALADNAVNAAKVDETEIVTISGTQTISGDKTFTGEVHLDDDVTLGAASSGDNAEVGGRNNSVTITPNGVIAQTGLHFQNGHDLTDASLEHLFNETPTPGFQPAANPPLASLNTGSVTWSNTFNPETDSRWSLQGPTSPPANWDEWIGSADLQLKFSAEVATGVVDFYNNNNNRRLLWVRVGSAGTRWAMFEFHNYNIAERDGEALYFNFTGSHVRLLESDGDPPGTSDGTFFYLNCTSSGTGLALATFGSDRENQVRTQYGFQQLPDAIGRYETVRGVTTGTTVLSIQHHDSSTYYTGCIRTDLGLDDFIYMVKRVIVSSDGTPRTYWSRNSDGSSPWDGTTTNETTITGYTYVENVMPTS